MKLEWQVQIQSEPNGSWQGVPATKGFSSLEQARRVMSEVVSRWKPKKVNYRIVPDGPDPELDDTVLVLAPDNPFVGVVVEINQPDQGAFEYYVMKDNAHSGYWDRESLVVLEWLREAP